MNDLSKLILTTVTCRMQPVSERRVALDKVADFGISTALTPDMGYETALGRPSDSWHPVERYDSRENAAAGHAQWVARLRAGEREFTELGYGDLFDSKPLVLRDEVTPPAAP